MVVAGGGDGFRVPAPKPQCDVMGADWLTTNTLPHRRRGGLPWARR